MIAWDLMKAIEQINEERRKKIDEAKREAETLSTGFLTRYLAAYQMTQNPLQKALIRIGLWNDDPRATGYHQVVVSRIPSTQG